MRRPPYFDLATAAFLVFVGVVARVAFQDIPNFAPVAALALFAGYVLRSRLLAVCVPLSVMVVSDRLVDAGGYALPLMLTVYVLLAVPVLFGGLLQRYAASFFGLVGGSLVSSIAFFLGTNWMVWMTSSWYEPTWNGLLACFAQGIPFFRFTLAGDAVFAFVLFGGYAVACSLASTSHREAAAE